ncbi:mitotic checkpoint regulator, MAD2B-interacting-domain-containing protein [Coniella lustricola]|uniref:Mitotic checkpoint regulator, MAD2B-interacting-domain-containing protein n=1 Tax=Coniella lustricola TaxID=2025994 RepID=A0A2T3ANA5_9PEZI|nr:mitotic checkpoint regulator, MAD2B-interacting-domain-containing protein [Coniella lustricola]
MGLVDYSDSESDGDSVQDSSAAAPSAKKSFQKLVDKTNPAKIVVSLPPASSAKQDVATSEQPAAKRLKTGGSRFSGFNSFLPAPKAVNKPAMSASNAGSSAPRVGVNLKTSAEAAFSRDAPVTAAAQAEDDQGDGLTAGTNGPGLKLPPPKGSAPSSAQPSIPEGQKPAEEVKLVGKPLMFKPLSVVRKPGKKLVTPKARVGLATTTIAASGPAEGSGRSSAAAASEETKAAPPPKKTASLFSFADETPTVDTALPEDMPYEAEFTSYDNGAAAQNTSSAYYAQPPAQYESYPQTYAVSSNAQPDSLGAIADDLNLDPVARRELFGRGGGGSKATAKSVINFNLDQEYRHNEELRATGALDAQQHNPLRAIKPGKHSLQQLVNQVQTQKDALEENFAKNRATQKQAGSKYGFR